jgi:hypothetical protein
MSNLEILTKAKENLIQIRKDEPTSTRSLCFVLSSAIEEHFEDKITVEYDEIEQYIPLFTRKNAIEWCNGTKEGVYWFTNDTDRFNFINLLIEKENEE